MKITRRNLVILSGIIAFFVILIVIQLMRPRVAVTTYTVKTGRIEEIVSSVESGTLEPVRRARLRAEVGGRVTEIVKKEGDRVKKGEVIIRIDNEDAIARVNLQRGNLEVQKARLQIVEGNLKNLTDKLEKLKKLYDEGAVTENQLKDLETQFNAVQNEYIAARSAVEQGESLLKISNLELKKTEITAPFDGLITEINVREGEDINSISVPLLSSKSAQQTDIVSSITQSSSRDYACEIIDDSEFYVEAPFDESDAMLVRTGFPVRLTSDALDEEALTGSVTFVAPHVGGVKEGVRSVKIKVAVKNSENMKLLPGMSMDVDIVVNSMDDTIIIPTNSIIERDGTPCVFLLDGKKAVLKKITTGISNWEWTEVKDGLKPGERIIISLDNPELKDGVRVKIKND
jgi:HlyD family secretion protein